MNEILSLKEKKVEVIKTEVTKKRKSKYEKTMQEIIYYMLNDKNIISLVDASHVYIPNQLYRNMIREITYFYQKHGFINMADFLSYVTDSEMKNSLNEIISLDLSDKVDGEVVLDLLKVIKDYNVSLEIKRLENLIMNEVDPKEQAKISNEIMKLKMGREIYDK